MPPRGKKALPALKGFAPFPPETAKEFARRAFAMSEGHNSRVTGICKLCAHPDREQIDYFLLIGASQDQLQAASGLDYAPMDVFEKHRDHHLMPAVKSACPDPMGVLAIPYPSEQGNKAARNRWHFWRFWAYAELSVQQGGLTAAIAAQREMRLIDLENDGMNEKQAQRVGDKDTEIQPAQQREAEILKHFTETTYRKRGEEDESSLE